MATWTNVSEKVFAVVQPEKMNTAEHQLGGRVQKERRERALTELRNRLNDAAVNARMSQTELARNARLIRTTVWNALRKGGGVPSDKTVAALAEAMRLKQAERKELLDLRRTADEKGQAAVVCRVLGDVPFEADCYVERPEVAARHPWSRTAGGGGATGAPPPSEPAAISP
ncbi:hypothetical protein AB5L52_42235 [Streptomyces sp. CG4]|uniref:hypothetical protein n=1 Tax=Streptomyces sp. CG4 TaxID=408783 RepID=UPI0034E25575